MLAEALVTKCRIARARGLDLNIVTQFAFDAAPIVAWERRIRAAGIDAPVRVGLPGLTSPARLVKFGLSCGVGASLKVLRKQAGGVLKLATTPTYHPDETLLALAAAVAAEPASLLRAIHFFPFGALGPTAEWASGLRDGRFALRGARAAERHRLILPDHNPPVPEESPMSFPSDLRIAQAASLKPLGDVAAAMGIGPHLLEAYGENVAKIKLSAIEELADRPRAKYVVVSAVTPTPLGEGKTTTTVGLGQAMCAHRASGHGRDPAAVDGPDVRDQGRRGRRRLQPGRAHGDAQPAPHRRLPRGHRGAQPALGDAGQPPLPGQRIRASTRTTSPGGACSTSTTARCAT